MFMRPNGPLFMEISQDFRQLQAWGNAQPCVIFRYAKARSGVWTGILPERLTVAGLSLMARQIVQFLEVVVAKKVVKLNPKAVVQDVRDGMDDKALGAKYGLSLRNFQAFPDVGRTRISSSIGVGSQSCFYRQQDIKRECRPAPWESLGNLTSWQP